MKTSAKFVRILVQVKTLDCVSGFHWSTLEFSQTFASFSPGYEITENMFYFININIHINIETWIKVISAKHLWQPFKLVVKKTVG